MRKALAVLVATVLLLTLSQSTLAQESPLIDQPSIEEPSDTSGPELAPVADPDAPADAPAATPTPLVAAPFISARLQPPPTPTGTQRNPSPPSFPSGAPLSNRPTHSQAEIMNSIPSPVGVPMFVGPGESGFRYELSAVDAESSLGRLYRFTYDCPSGQCSGAPKDVWLAMPVAQKEAYLVSLTDAVAAAFPKQPSVEIDVNTGSGLNTLGAIKLRNGVHQFAEPLAGSSTDMWAWTDHLSH